MDHFDKLQKAVEARKIPEKLGAIIHNFYLSYAEAAQENGYTIAQLQSLLDQFLQHVIENLEHPYQFEPYHAAIRSPIDYYQFGLELLRPLVVFAKSTIQGKDHLHGIAQAIAKGENVILLANHQTEPDPQAISLLLENTHPQLAEEMIFVAGDRVITDPLAVPFSKGRNLLCIYSKRHIDLPPERKQEKLTHNQRTMKKMAQLLNEGGKCIYVAPSGGRDRRDPTGEIAIAPFDPQSIELFWLTAQHAEKKTHFHTLALATYDLLPPPSSVEKELGERRHASCTPLHLTFGPAIDMDLFPGSDCADKKERRQYRADYLWKRVCADYLQMTK